MDFSKACDPVELGAGVQAIILKDEEENFPSYEDPSKVLFVRPCIRTIYESIAKHRSGKPTGNAAVVGQPGIGKSYALFYFAYRFVKEDDVDAVLLENSEEEAFYVFYNEGFGTSQLPNEFRAKRKFRIASGPPMELLEKHFVANPRVVYLVDMGIAKMPIFCIRPEGYSLFSSSPRPYLNHIQHLQHKLDVQIYAPPLWTKDELKVVFKYDKKEDLNISTWKSKSTNRTFENYFNTFGGTIRPMYKAESEFRKMEEGSVALQQVQPDAILSLVGENLTVLDDDSIVLTHALFAEKGGSTENDYMVDTPRTKREFRSKFAEFWFKKYVAPRILIKSYSADALQVLYEANTKANGSVRGGRFEDIFHKLLPLGTWAIKYVPKDSVSGLESFTTLVGHYFGMVSNTSDYVETVDFKSIPIHQRSVEETVDEEDLSEWDAGDGSVNTEANRKDVRHLLNVWRNKDIDRFYWTPLGSDFPGLDSVCRDRSKLYFVQVKSEETATHTHRWIVGAFEYAKLLMEKMGNPTKMEVTILLGTEPSKTPTLGKRKRKDLENANYPNAWNLRYLSNCVGSVDSSKSLSLDESLCENLTADFQNFLKATSD